MYVLSAQFVNWAEPGDMRYGADHSPHDGNEKHNSKSYFFIILIATENMNMYRGKESDKKKRQELNAITIIQELCRFHIDTRDLHAIA